MKKLAEPGLELQKSQLAICIPVSNPLNNCRVEGLPLEACAYPQIIVRNRT